MAEWLKSPNSRTTSRPSLQQITLLYLLLAGWLAVISTSIVFVVKHQMPAFLKQNYFHSLPWIRVPRAPPTLSDRLGRTTGTPRGTMFTRLKTDNSPTNSKPATSPAFNSLKEKLSKCPFTLGFRHKNAGPYGRLTAPRDEGHEDGTQKVSRKR